MIKRRLLIGVALLGCVIIGFLLLPSEKGLERYESLYQRGQFEAVVSGLEGELARNPKWHEARELLVLASVNAGNPVVALEHMLLLKTANWDIKDVEEEYAWWFDTNWVDDETLSAWFGVATLVLEQRADWNWLKYHYLDTAIKRRIDKVVQALELVMTGDPALIDNALWEKVRPAWYLLRTSDDIETLWRISELLDSYDSHSLRWRGQLLDPYLSLDAISRLQTIYPGSPLLAAAVARGMEARAGLDFLNLWEESYQVDDESEDYYFGIKIHLLHQVRDIAYKDIDNIAPWTLLNFATAAIADQRHKAEVVLEWFEAQEQTEQGSLLREALAKP